MRENANSQVLHNSRYDNFKYLKGSLWQHEQRH